MMENYIHYEVQYMKILNNIMEDGYRQLNERTGIETIRIPHAVITVDLEKEFPILKSKQIFWKTALKEILWIMQKQSNNINDLDAHIWDAWADENGSIGKSYGYQIAKPVIADGITYDNQVDYILKRLEKDSSDRRAVLNLWDVDELHEMNLNPCCYSSVWTVIDGKLNCMLVQRSADYLVGVPFNTTQYALLTHLFARHLGLKVGQLTHCMADAHVYCYDSHLNGGKKMLKNFYNTCGIGLGVFDIPELVPVYETTPTITFNSEETDFFKITENDISVENYKYVEKINFDVAK